MQRPRVPYVWAAPQLKLAGSRVGFPEADVSAPPSAHPAPLPLQLDTGKTCQAVMRFDTDVELTYFRNGGILNYMIRKMAQ